MRLPAGQPLEQAELPEGITVRTFVPKLLSNKGHITPQFHVVAPLLLNIIAPNNL
jgi:hypothetical protein